MVTTVMEVMMTTTIKKSECVRDHATAPWLKQPGNALFRLSLQIHAEAGIQRTPDERKFKR